MGRVSQPKSEREWEAEEDFRTLTRAEEILSDKSRLGRAKTAGRKIVSNEKKALKTKERVASRRGGRKR